MPFIWIITRSSDAYDEHLYFESESDAKSYWLDYNEDRLTDYPEAIKIKNDHSLDINAKAERINHLMNGEFYDDSTGNHICCLPLIPDTKTTSCADNEFHYFCQHCKYQK